MFLGFLAACSAGPADAPPEPLPTGDLATDEPIAVRAGSREVRVRCAVACDGARAELTRQRDQCVADPTSTPHHVVARGPLVALGCCTESEHVYRQACGVEALEPCASRWLAECESGTLAP